MNTLRFIAACPFDDVDHWQIDETYHLTIGEVKGAMHKIDNLSNALRSILYTQVMDRYGSAVAQHMEAVDWKDWPPDVNFVDARIERVRKALIGP